MTFEPSENFWKTLCTKEDMINKIVWGAKSIDEFNVNTGIETDFIIQNLGLKELDKNSKVLDFGCGIGRLAKVVSEKTGLLVAGVDVSQPMINQARLYCENTHTIFAHMANGFSIPAENEIFSAVYSHIVLQHVHKYKVFFILKDFFRTLKSGGKGFIQLPLLNNNLHDYEGYAKDFIDFNDVQISAMNFWTMEEVTLILQYVGFKVLDIKVVGTDMFVLFEKVKK